MTFYDFNMSRGVSHVTAKKYDSIVRSMVRNHGLKPGNPNIEHVMRSILTNGYYSFQGKRQKRKVLRLLLRSLDRVPTGTEECYLKMKWTVCRLRKKEDAYRNRKYRCYSMEMKFTCPENSIYWALHDFHYFLRTGKPVKYEDLYYYTTFPNI